MQAKHEPMWQMVMITAHILRRWWTVLICCLYCNPKGYPCDLHLLQQCMLRSLMKNSPDKAPICTLSTTESGSKKTVKTHVHQQ